MGRAFLNHSYQAPQSFICSTIDRRIPYRFTAVHDYFEPSYLSLNRDRNFPQHVNSILEDRSRPGAVSKNHPSLDQPIVLVRA